MRMRTILHSQKYKINTIDFIDSTETINKYSEKFEARTAL